MVTERSEVMSSARMEERLEQLEANLKKMISRLEESLGVLMGGLKEVETALGLLVQKFDVLFQQSSMTQSTSPESSGVNAPPPPALSDKSEDPNQLPPRAESQQYQECFRVYRREPDVRVIELPAFEGEEADIWICRAECYFAVREMSEAEKLLAVRFCLQGPALIWLMTKERERPFATWQEFRSQFVRRYSEAESLQLRQRFFSIRQEGSVAAYRGLFELLSTQIEDLTEESFMAIFMNGLDKRINAEIMIYPHDSLRRVMELAELIEEKTRSQGRW